MKPDDKPDVRDLLNAQTGRVGWAELQRHFARGSVLRVAAGLDLIEVAATIVEDDSQRLRDWLSDGSVRKADTADARRWQAEQSQFWAVVAAPWVLVQEINRSDA